MIQVHNDATQDLIDIKAVSESAFFKIVAFIQELQASPRLQKKLLEHDVSGSARCMTSISAKKWLSVWKMDNTPVWRLRNYDLEKQGLNYRIFYFFHYETRNYYIMAIMERGRIDYDDPNSPLRNRIIDSIRKEFSNY